jgi:hypothetical protein
MAVHQSEWKHTSILSLNNIAQMVDIKLTIMFITVAL